MDPIDLTTSFPAHWTVRRALDAYLTENGFTRESYDAPYVWVSFWSLTFPFPNPPSRQKAVRFHDLHHVATGYGTDPAGEAEISAYELRRGLKGLSLFVKGIVTTGALFGLLHAPKRTKRAWDASESGALLFDGSIDEQYEALLDLSVGELRTRMGLPLNGIAGERGLHSAAPRPSSLPSQA